MNDEQSYKGNFVILKSLDYEVAGVVQVQIKVKVSFNVKGKTNSNGVALEYSHLFITYFQEKFCQCQFKQH